MAWGFCRRDTLQKIVYVVTVLIWWLLITVISICMIQHLNNRHNYPSVTILLQNIHSPAFSFLHTIPHVNFFFRNLINLTLRNPLHSQNLSLSRNPQTLQSSLTTPSNPSVFTLHSFRKTFHSHRKHSRTLSSSLFSQNPHSRALSLSCKHSDSANPIITKPNIPSQKTIVVVCSICHRRWLEGRPPCNDSKHS